MLSGENIIELKISRQVSKNKLHKSFEREKKITSIFFLFIIGSNRFLNM